LRQPKHTGTLYRHGICNRRHSCYWAPESRQRRNLLGIITRELLAERYLALLQLAERLDRPLGAIAAVLEGELLVGKSVADCRRSWVSRVRERR
jgi:hypothetical protein